MRVDVSRGLRLHLEGWAERNSTTGPVPLGGGRRDRRSSGPGGHLSVVVTGVAIAAGELHLLIGEATVADLAPEVEEPPAPRAGRGRRPTPRPPTPDVPEHLAEHQALARRTAGRCRRARRLRPSSKIHQLTGVRVAPPDHPRQVDHHPLRGRRPAAPMPTSISGSASAQTVPSRNGTSPHGVLERRQIRKEARSSSCSTAPALDAVHHRAAQLAPGSTRAPYPTRIPSSWDGRRPARRRTIRA